MDILVAIIFIGIMIFILAKIFKKLLIFILLAALIFALRIYIELPFLSSVVLSIIIFKGCKDTLFNLSVIVRYLFRSRYKFKERSLGKLVSILFEVNFTVFICLCYMLLISYVPSLFNIDFQVIVITFATISFVQMIKQFAFKKSYSYNLNRFSN